jgi:DNA-binding MarR family transcriptional regulator
MTIYSRTILTQFRTGLNFCLTRSGSSHSGQSRESLRITFWRKPGRNLAKIRFGRTQQELAEFFGVARPSLSRALKELEDDGFIIAEGKEMTILNREGLVKLTRQQG